MPIVRNREWFLITVGISVLSLISTALLVYGFAS